MSQCYDIIIPRGPWNATDTYYPNDWVAHNNQAWIASVVITPNNEPTSTSTVWMPLVTALVTGPRGLTGTKGDYTRPVYARAVSQPPNPTGTWNGTTLSVDPPWHTNIVSGQGLLWRADALIDNSNNSLTFTDVYRWTGPTGPQPNDARINALLNQAIVNMDLQSGSEVTDAIETYLRNNNYTTETQVEQLINVAYSNVLADLGVLQVEFSLDGIVWDPNLNFYTMCRIRLNNPDADWTVINFGQVASGLLGQSVIVEFSREANPNKNVDSDWHAPPATSSDRWFAITVGTGDRSDPIPLGMGGGMTTTGLPVTVQFSSNANADPTDDSQWHDAPQVSTDLRFAWMAGDGARSTPLSLETSATTQVDILTNYSVDATTSWHRTRDTADNFARVEALGGGIPSDAFRLAPENIVATYSVDGTTFTPTQPTGWTRLRLHLDTADPTSLLEINYTDLGISGTGGGDWRGNYDNGTEYSQGDLVWANEAIYVSRRNSNRGNAPGVSGVAVRTQYWDPLSGRDVTQIEKFFAREERTPNGDNSHRLEPGTVRGEDGWIEANTAARWYDTPQDIPVDRHHLTLWSVLVHSKNNAQEVIVESVEPYIDPIRIAENKAAVESSFPVIPLDSLNGYRNFAYWGFTRSASGEADIDLVDVSFVDSSGTVLASGETFSSNEQGRLSLNDLGARASELRRTSSTVGRISIQITRVYAQIVGTLTHEPTQMNASGGQLEIAYSNTHTHIAWTALGPNDEPMARMIGTVTLTEQTISNNETEGMIVVARLEPTIGTTPFLTAGDPTTYPALYAQDAQGVRFQSVPFTYPTPSGTWDDDIDVNDLFLMGYVQNNTSLTNSDWQFFANNLISESSSASSQTTSPIIVTGAYADLAHIFWTDTFSADAASDFSGNIVGDPFGDGLYGLIDRKSTVRATTGSGGGIAEFVAGDPTDAGDYREYDDVIYKANAFDDGNNGAPPHNTNFTSIKTLSLKASSRGAPYTNANVRYGGHQATLTFDEPAASAWEYDTNTQVWTFTDFTGRLHFNGGQTINGTFRFENTTSTFTAVQGLGARLIKNRGIAGESTHILFRIAVGINIPGNSIGNDTFAAPSREVTINLTHGDTLELEHYTEAPNVVVTDANISTTDHGEQSGTPGGDEVEIVYDLALRQWVMTNENGDENPIFTGDGEPVGENKAYIDGQDLIPLTFYLDTDRPTEQFTPNQFGWNATNNNFDLPSGVLRARPATVAHTLYFVFAFRTASETPTIHTVLPTVAYNVGSGGGVASGDNIGQEIASLTMPVGDYSFVANNAIGSWVLNADAPSQFGTRDSGGITATGVTLPHVKVSDTHEGYWVRAFVGTDTDPAHDVTFNVGAPTNYPMRDQTGPLSALTLLVDPHAASTDYVQIISSITTTYTFTADNVLTFRLYLKTTGVGTRGLTGERGRIGLNPVSETYSGTLVANVADVTAQGDVHWINDANIGNFTIWAGTDEDYWGNLRDGNLITGHIDDDNYVLARITSGTDTANPYTYEFEVIEQDGRLDGKTDPISLGSSQAVDGTDGAPGQDGVSPTVDYGRIEEDTKQLRKVSDITDIAAFPNFGYYSFSRSADGSSGVDLCDLDFYSLDDNNVDYTLIEADVTFSSDGYGRLSLDDIAQQCFEYRTRSTDPVDADRKIVARLKKRYLQTVGTITISSLGDLEVNSGIMEVAYSDDLTSIEWSATGTEGIPLAHCQGSTREDATGDAEFEYIYAGYCRFYNNDSGTIYELGDANTYPAVDVDRNGIDFNSGPWKPTRQLGDENLMEDMVVGFASSDQGGNTALYYLFANGSYDRRTGSFLSRHQAGGIRVIGRDVYTGDVIIANEFHAFDNFNNLVLRSRYDDGLFGRLVGLDETLSTDGLLGFSAVSLTFNKEYEPTTGTLADDNIQIDTTQNTITLLQSGLTSDQLESLQSITTQTPVNIYTADFSKRLNVIVTGVTTPTNNIVLAYTDLPDAQEGTFADGDALVITVGSGGLTHLSREFDAAVSSQTELDAIDVTAGNGINFATVDQDFGTYRKHDLLFYNGSSWERIYRVWQEFSESGTSNWQNTRAHDENWTRFVINGLPTTPFLIDAANRLLSGPINQSPISPRFTITRTGLQTDWENKAEWDFQDNPHFNTDRNTFTTDAQSGQITTTGIIGTHNLVAVTYNGSGSTSISRIDVYLRRYPEGSQTHSLQLSLANDTTIRQISHGATIPIRVNLNQAGTITFASTDRFAIEIEVQFQNRSQDYRIPWADFQYDFSGNYGALPPYIHLDDHVQVFHDPNLPASEQEVRVIDYFRKRILLDSLGIAGNVRTVDQILTNISFDLIGEWNRVIHWGDLPDTFSIEENIIVNDTGESTIVFGDIASATSNLRGYNEGSTSYELTEMIIEVEKFSAGDDPETATPTDTIELAHLRVSQEMFSAGAAADIPMESTTGPRTIQLEDGEQLRLTITPTPSNDDFQISGNDLLIPFTVEVNELPAAEIDIEGDLLRAKDEIVSEDPYPIANLHTKRSLLYTEQPAVVYYVEGQTTRTLPNTLYSSTEGKEVDTEDGAIIPFNDPPDELHFEPDDTYIQQVNEDDVLVDVDGQSDDDFDGKGDNTGVFKFTEGTYNIDAEFQIRIDNDGTQSVVMREATLNDVPIGDHHWRGIELAPDGNYYCLEYQFPSNNGRVFTYGQEITPGRSDHYISAFNVLSTDEQPWGVAVSPTRVWVLIEHSNPIVITARSFGLDGTRHSGEDRTITAQTGLPRAATYDHIHNKMLVMHADARETGKVIFYNSNFSDHLQTVDLPNTRNSSAVWKGISLDNDGNIVCLDTTNGGTLRTFHYPTSSDSSFREITDRGHRYQVSVVNYVDLTNRPSDNALMMIPGSADYIASYRDGHRNQHDRVLARSVTYKDSGIDGHYQTYKIDMKYFRPNPDLQYYFEVVGVDADETYHVIGYGMFIKTGD